MEEKFLTGYCRQLDASRMVEVVLDGGEIDEVDCLYGSCQFQTQCTIAKGIEDLKKA